MLPIHLNKSKHILAVIDKVEALIKTLVLRNHLLICHVHVFICP